ncbi:MAG: hypothetical protein U0T83_06845 [Bacteriovoracaceae bacterium]
MISFALRGAGDTFCFVTTLATLAVNGFPSYLFVNDINGVYKAWLAASVYIVC